MVKIKWTNKYSGETGYVESVSSKNRCFTNTYDEKKAKEYSEKAVKGILTKLASYNETENNDFEVIEVAKPKKAAKAKAAKTQKKK